MLRHVAVYTWKPGTTDEQIEAFRAGVLALLGQIPEIRALTLGPDAGLSDGNDAFALVADFDDAEAYRRYATNPTHLDVIERLLTPIRATRHAVQLEYERE